MLEALYTLARTSAYIETIGPDIDLDFGHPPEQTH